MKTMKLRKFAEFVKAKRDKLLSLSATSRCEALTWKPNCGVLVVDKAVGVRELNPDGTLDDALARVKRGKVHLVFSDLGEVTLRLRP